MSILYLDTEFNGWGGELISLAIYNPNGPHFYEVLQPKAAIDPWVAEHVIPYLDKAPIGREEFCLKLQEYLKARPEDQIIVADWPADFVHLFDALMIYGQWRVDIPVTAWLLNSPPLNPKIPHNALSDAEALAEWHYS